MDPFGGAKMRLLGALVSPVLLGLKPGMDPFRRRCGPRRYGGDTGGRIGETRNSISRRERWREQCGEVGIHEKGV